MFLLFTSRVNIRRQTRAPEFGQIVRLNLTAPVHGEPDGGPVGIGPFDAVTNMRRKLDIVAGLQNPRLVFAFDEKTCRAGKNDDPFRTVLVVPEAGGARLPGRNDPLDSGARPVDERLDLLLGQPRRDIGEKIGASDDDSLS
jgi:hypothetical protein